MVNTRVTTTTSTHLMQVIGTGADQRCRVICPDGGVNCECWVECGETHRCDCGSTEHEHSEDCDPDCDEDHALDCDEWLWRDGMLHGDFHQYVGSMVCVKGSGCWMPDWEIEFDQVEDLVPGLYEFDYEEPDTDDAGLLYVLAMRPRTTGRLT